MISKNTVNNVIDAIRCIIQKSISSEVTQAVMFSVQIDTTQDISAKDQCPVILRYVNDVVHERLVAVVSCEASSGRYFSQLVKEVIDTLQLDMSNCIGNSTDGAANMKGQYNGFSALLFSHSPNQVHVWCYAHILNLVMGDTTGVVIESASLFSLLNDLAVFIRESYQRMNVWEKKTQDPHHRRLSSIGETRWWAKDAALKKVF